MPIERILTLHNVTIHIKSVLNEDKNHCYYKIFLEKCLYQLAKKQTKIFVHSIIMLRFGEREREIAKEKLLCFKKVHKNLGC